MIYTSYMKKISLACLLLMIIICTGCKNESVFIAPTYVFLKWSEAIKNLDYKSYSECEFLPKERSVFRDMYGRHYFSDVFVSEVDKLKEDNILTDKRDYKYRFRNVNFECKRVDRRSNRVVDLMRGEVEFIKFMEGPDSKKGWLMFNRTITRIGLTR